MVNGLLGAEVPSDQPLMEAGLDSIGAHARCNCHPQYVVCTLEKLSCSMLE